MLILDGKLGQRIILHNSTIVCAAQAAEKAVRQSEKGHQFNVGIMFGGIGHNMVDIMTSLPPAQTQTTKVVANDHANHSINLKVVSDTHMTGVMGSEDQLMPKAPEEKCGQAKPRTVQKKEEEREEKRISTDFDGIGIVVAVVKTGPANALIEMTVFLDDVFLVFGIEGRIFGQIQEDLFLSDGIDHV